MSKVLLPLLAGVAILGGPTVLLVTVVVFIAFYYGFDLVGRVLYGPRNKS